MVKPLTENGKPPKLNKRANGRVTLTRQYELITPLFGGGVEASVVDVENPIRGTAVRGHLRFWWRATRGGRFDGDLARMKAREDEIFGAAEIGSKVSIAISESKCGDPINVNDLGFKLRYAAFPLIEEEGNVCERVYFTLTINFPKTYKSDLKAGNFWRYRRTNTQRIWRITLY